MAGDDEEQPNGGGGCRGAVPKLRKTSIPLPRPLVMTGCMKKNWDKFRQVWDSYEIITGLDKQEDKIRIAHFITAIGTEVLETHNGLPFKTDEEKKPMEVVLKGVLHPRLVFGLFLHFSQKLQHIGNK